MKILKKLLLVILMTSQVATADCSLSCKQALDAADKVIADLHKEVDIYKHRDKDEVEQITSLSVSLNEENQALAAWYHNPFVIGTLGLLVGAAGATYLLKK